MQISLLGHPKRNGLSEGTIVSMTKIYMSLPKKKKKILFSLLKSSKSDESLVEICGSSYLFGISMMKNCVVFCLTYFGTCKYDWMLKTKVKFDSLLLINTSVTTRCSFSLLIISAIISSNTINTFLSFLESYHSILL